MIFEVLSSLETTEMLTSAYIDRLPEDGQQAFREAWSRWSEGRDEEVSVALRPASQLWFYEGWRTCWDYLEKLRLEIIEKNSKSDGNETL